MLNRLFSLRCPECGERIDENERYCPHCGIDLEVPVEFAVDRTKSKAHLEKAQKNYDKDGNLKVALRDCELSIQYDPNSVEAHNLRGLILDALGQTDKAIASYQEALRINPAYEDAKANLDDAQSEFQNSLAPKNNSFVLKAVLVFTGLVTVASVIVLMGVLYKSIRPYFEPNTIIILEPDYSLIPTVDPSELEATVQILIDRSQSLGYRGVSFEISEDSQIVCRVPGQVDTQIFIERIIAIGLLEFVDFGDTALPEGAFVATDFDYKYLPEPDGIIWHTIMTNNEIEFASANKNERGQYSISLILTQEGAKIIFDYTTQNLNKFLGIVLDKHIVSMPRINNPIPDGNAEIAGNFNEESAENLATYLKIKEPLPIPLKVKEASKENDR